MNKQKLNRFFRRFGFEVHGTGYLQALQKSDFQQDAFVAQRDLLGADVRMIFDVGANRGDTVLRYRSLFPSAHIQAFEPFPSTFTQLKGRTESLGHLDIHPLALSDKSGTSSFYANVNEDTNSLLKSAEMGLSSDEQVRNREVIQVKTETLDNFCQGKGIHHIDILKLDIQGGEHAALTGAGRLLREKRIGLIYTESYFRPQYERQPLFHDIAALLYAHGYNLQDLYSPIYGKGSIAWCDAIFMPIAR